MWKLHWLFFFCQVTLIILNSDVIGKRNCSIVCRCIGEQIKWVQSWCKEGNTVALGLLGGRKGIRPVKISATCLQRGKPRETDLQRFIWKITVNMEEMCWWFCVAPCVANKLEAKWHKWLLAAWLSCSTLVSISEVTLHRAWLVLGWVTIYGRVNTSVCDQPLRPTQPSTLSGMESEYWPKCGDTLQLGSKGRCSSFSL